MRLERFARAMSAALLIALAPVSAPGAEPGAAEAVTYLSGGIGEAEQAALAAREKEFNLKLIFSLAQGNYVADVDVVVSDGKGRKVIERSAQGPFVLARLPAGPYTIAATRQGKTVTRNVKVATGRLRTEHLRWPAAENDLPVSRWLDKN